MTNKPKADPRIATASAVVAEGMAELFNALVAGGHRTHPEDTEKLQTAMQNKECSLHAVMEFDVDGFQSFLF